MPSITFKDFQGGLDLRQGSTVADANRLRVLKNAYVTTGKSIKKRPALKLEASFAEAGESQQMYGLFAINGKLVTFHGYALSTSNIANTPDSRFYSYYLNNPSGAYSLTGVECAFSFAGETTVGYELKSYPMVQAIWENAAPYQRTVTFIGQASNYAVPSQPVSVSDFNQNKPMIKKSNRVWITSQDSENVFFSKLNDARTWGSTPSVAADAGFLSVASNQNSSTRVTALGEYGNKLIVFFSDSTQIWTVDPDQTLNKLDQIIPIGTKFPFSHVAVGNDIFFVSPQGIRSISQVSDIVGNLSEYDVGSPINSMLVGILGFFGENEPKAFYLRSFGQVWFYANNKALVYTFSQSSKISCWSVYEFSVNIEYMCELDDKVYIRSGRYVYSLDSSAYIDYPDILIDVQIELPFLDFKQSGVLKQVIGLDAMFSGTANLQHRFDSLNPSIITEPISLTGDTRARGVVPVELMTTSLSPVITHSANESFELFGLVYYFESLGVFP
jgi:hypothetical protein